MDIRVPSNSSSGHVEGLSLSYSTTEITYEPETNNGKTPSDICDGQTVSVDNQELEKAHEGLETSAVLMDQPTAFALNREYEVIADAEHVETEPRDINTIREEHRDDTSVLDDKDSNVIQNTSSDSSIHDSAPSRSIDPLPARDSRIAISVLTASNGEMPISPSTPLTSSAKHTSTPFESPRNSVSQASDGFGKESQRSSVSGARSNGRSSRTQSSLSGFTHKRSITVSKGNTVSVVLISSALETIASSREAKRSSPLKESVQLALEMVRSGEGGDKGREIFEPLRLACETRNEKLMIASLDCIAKLIAYSFFVESTPGHSQSDLSPPPSPGLNGRRSSSSQQTIPEPSLVDIVVNTITSCHTENTPETVSLQIVKALLALVLSPTVLVHQSSLLKAVRTVYNIFLLSTDPVNQTVAQGGLTQIVNHVFARCMISDATPGSPEDLPARQEPGSSHSPLSPVSAVPPSVTTPAASMDHRGVPEFSPPAVEQQLAEISSIQVSSEATVPSEAAFDTHSAPEQEPEEPPNV
jgi:brefeldin A-inhibited guanine nucleotide-exchange protein